jgi:hypothetical protein
MTSTGMTMTETAADIADAIFFELYRRKGFDGWWGGIDEDIQEEIKETLVRHALDRLVEMTRTLKLVPFNEEVK